VFTDTELRFPRVAPAGSIGDHRADDAPQIIPWPSS